MAHQNINHSSAKRQSTFRILLTSAAIGLILCICAFAVIRYELVNHRVSIPGTPLSGTSNNTAGKDTPSNAADSPSGSTSSTAGHADSNSVIPKTLISPNGNFVSNHHPHLDNMPSGSAYITSICNTTPGATCQISFTNAGVTKSLPAMIADSRGAASWINWRPQDYGISQGSWTITANAKLGDQSETATDALKLEVE